MTFEEIGAALRAEREKRHLSIDDVANELKINARLLRALENGDTSALPQAYARGFIRSYSSFLGFSPEEIQGWLSELQPAPSKKHNPIPENEPAEYEPPVKRQSEGIGKALAACLLLCILGCGGWWLWQSGRLPFLGIKKEEPAEILNNLPHADAYKPTPPPPAEPAPQTVPVPIQRPTPLAEALEPQAPATPAQAVAPEETTENGFTSTVEKSEPAKPETEPQIEPHKLVIVAIEECWVHSTADKTDTRQFSLRKGDTFALTFADILELKLGNAGGVRLRYDGMDLPAPGTSGQVRTLTFPPQN